jgi:hypothetical protein
VHACLYWVHVYIPKQELIICMYEYILTSVHSLDAYMDDFFVCIQEWIPCMYVYKDEFFVHILTYMDNVYVYMDYFFVYIYTYASM